MKKLSLKKHIYVALELNNTIKIGISKHPSKRFREIENSSGKTIIKTYISPPTINASKIEKLVFSKFGLNRLKGEWFDNITFDEVVLHLRFYDYSNMENIY